MPATPTETPLANRRPLKTRAAAWPHRLARTLAEARLSANAISLLGLAFALIGCAVLVASVRFTGSLRIACFIGAAVCVQLRLLCNLLDGLVAVENNRRSKVGELYNEVPDRFADVALLVGAGIALNHPLGATLGWTAATLAVGTAYIRMVGASILGTHDFCGPFAKPQRMAALTIACLATAVDIATRGTTWILFAGMVLTAVGTAFTVFRRLRRIGRAMAAR